MQIARNKNSCLIVIRFGLCKEQIRNCGNIVLKRQKKTYSQSPLLKTAFKKARELHFLETGEPFKNVYLQEWKRCFTVESALRVFGGAFPVMLTTGQKCMRLWYDIQKATFGQGFPKTASALMGVLPVLLSAPNSAVSALRFQHTKTIVLKVCCWTRVASRRQLNKTCQNSFGKARSSCIAISLHEWRVSWKGQDGQCSEKQPLTKHTNCLSGTEEGWFNISRLLAVFSVSPLKFRRGWTLTDVCW